MIKKFIILQKTFDKLNLPKEDILSDNPKGIYFGFTCDGSKKFLQKLTDIVPDLSKQKSISDIFTWWINKWAIQRFNHLIKTDRLKIIDDNL